MDQDRQDAQAWAKEWAIRKKNSRVIKIIIGVLIAVLAWLGLQFMIVHLSRTTYDSEGEMKQAMQGSFVYDEYEELTFEGNKIYLTYYDVRDYKEGSDENEYNEYTDSYYDSTYEDKVTKWDYRNGKIENEWLGEMIIDGDGNIQYESRNFKRSKK